MKSSFPCNSLWKDWLEAVASDQSCTPLPRHPTTFRNGRTLDFVQESVPTYEEVAPILAERCQSCHSNAADMGLGGVSVDTEAEVLEHADTILKALEFGWMPYEDPEWHKTPEGQK